MGDFFKSAVFQAALLALALLLWGLAVWFIGPLLSFGGLQPLASVGLRATVIVLSVLLALLWKFHLPKHSVLVALACLLIWHASPLLAIGESRPLEAAWLRATLIGLVALAYALYGVYRLWEALRNNESLLQKILHPRGKAEPEPAHEAIAALQTTARRAVARLKTMRLGTPSGQGVSALRRVLEGKRYLYELPWFLLIGRPGSGKTTTLLNSGLTFPLADQMRAAGAQATLEQGGETAQCEWWFTNDAVWLDTTGRYTQPDNHETDTPTQAEWLGLLRVLRKARPRAPINGALLTVDVRELLNTDDAGRIAHAAALRGRLVELRQQLGIRFPVYVLVTKTDLLPGFIDYFNALGNEARHQVWGFTLPWRAHAGWRARRAALRAEHADSGLRAQMRTELAALGARLRAGLPIRLQEEFEPARRARLYALPQEFAALGAQLADFLERVFAESRFDDTQNTHMLRGVYFTSVRQTPHDTVAADAQALCAQLRQRAPQADTPGASTPAASQHSFFVRELLKHVVFPEAGLVRPNLRWEANHRLLRWAGHAAVAAVSVWLTSGLWLSFTNNTDYLAQVSQKTQALRGQLEKLYAHYRHDQAPAVMTAAQDLASHRDLDPANPAAGFLYGLYTAPDILAASERHYAYLQDTLIVPSLVARMEAVLRQSVTARDSQTTYDTLTVYLLLHDAERFARHPTAGEELKAWVQKDWQGQAPRSESETTPVTVAETNRDDGQMFGGQAAMLAHVDTLLSGKRVVHATSRPNEALVQQARAFLNSRTNTQRLYQRIKAIVSPEAPPEFTLVRAIGPQAGTVFVRASQQPLEKGVPGLFTYDGYHQLFSKRLPELMPEAADQDAWVMGIARRAGAGGELTRGLAAVPLVEEVRRQYLREYTEHWALFLGDIRAISGANLAFDANVVRQLAAPDSPLARLARASARETTLSRPLQGKPEEEKSLLDKTAEGLDKQVKEARRNLGMNAAARAEKELVDTPFAALREVVTGQSEGAQAGAASKGASLEAVLSVLNEFYTSMVVAETAVASQAPPPSQNEAAGRLALEANKLSSPLKEILSGLAKSGVEKIHTAAAGVLRSQAQAQFDRLIGQMALQVSDPCRRAIEGRYPFAASAQEVAVDDFNALFAAGGAADEYFNKYLLPYVDTSVRPWRYKTPDAAAQVAAATGGNAGNAPPTAGNVPSLTGELLKILAEQGPNPDTFAQMGQIRDMFFREPGAKRLAWKVDVKVVELDATITELVMDFDGQVQRYAHGPQQTLQVSWPGQRGGSLAEITAFPRVRPDTSTQGARGPWSILRLLEKSRASAGVSSQRALSEFNFDGRKALLDIQTSGGVNPISHEVLKTFRCPGRA